MVEAKVERGPKDYTVDPSNLVLHSHRGNPQTRSGLKREAPEASTLSSNSILKTFPLGNTTKLVQKIGTQNCTYTSISTIIKARDYPYT